MEYDLELNKVVKEINKNKVKTTLIQLPDGLKPKAVDIVKYLESKTNSKVFIWAGSCYGACDLPSGEYDLVVQFGHNKWSFY